MRPGDVDEFTEVVLTCTTFKIRKKEQELLDEINRLKAKVEELEEANLELRVDLDYYKDAFRESHN
jgi:hypothetical protein